MILTILAFLLMVTVLVAAHEYGHYLIAKKCGMKVEEFAIGMGPGKWVYARKDETEFTLRPLPLGGFVRIVGMVPEEDGSETTVRDGFYSKGPWARIWTLLAGPGFSLLAGFVLLVPIWASLGQKRPINEPVLGYVAENRAAAKAGLKAGDKVVSVNGAPVVTFYDIITKVRDVNGAPTQIEYVRDGKTSTVTVTPEVDTKPSPVFDSDLNLTWDERKQSKIGIAFREDRVPLGVGGATVEALKAPVTMVYELGRRIARPDKLVEAVGGPETMVRATNAAVNESFARFVELAGLISMSLAIFNLLPIAPLDGGQIMVAFMELFRRGRRLSFKTQGVIQYFGLCIVFLMFVSFIAIDRIRWSQIAADVKQAEQLEKERK